MAKAKGRGSKPPDPSEIANAQRQLERNAGETFKEVRKTAQDVLLAPITGGLPADPRRDKLYSERHDKQCVSDRLAIATIAAFDPRAAVTHEGILDADDLLQLDYLVKGIAAAAAIGQIRIRGGPAVGTGFICAPGMIMTNAHVISSHAVARHFEIVFEGHGDASSEHTVGLAPDHFFFSSPRDALDVTIVAMDEDAGSSLTKNLGWHPFRHVQGKIALGRPVSIIQYPRGRGKQIVLHNSILLQIADVGEQEIAGDIVPLDTPYLWYTSDTMRGSSGSPVFNRNFEIIALHHASVPKRFEDGNFAAQDGSQMSYAEYDANPEKAVFIANRGIRASRIVSALRAHTDFVTSDMAARRTAILESWDVKDGQAVIRQRLRARVLGLGQDHGKPAAMFESADPRGSESPVNSVLFEEIVRRLQDGSMTIGFR